MDEMTKNAIKVIAAIPLELEHEDGKNEIWDTIISLARRLDND